MPQCSQLGWCSSATEDWHDSGFSVALTHLKACPLVPGQLYIPLKNVV